MVNKALNMKRIIFIIISCFVFGTLAFAQEQKVIDKEFEKFTTVKVQDNFVVKLMKSDRYAVKINVDERIASHVQAYEKNGTLYLILDEKGYTKELKKELKQKGAVLPVLEALVYMPLVNSLIFSDNTSVVYSDELSSEDFTLTASDNVKIKQLKVACATADMDVLRSAEVSLDMKVDSCLVLTTENSAKVSMTQNGGTVLLEAKGNSKLNAKVSVQSVEVVASSGSESNISGTADMMKVNATGLSRTNTESLDVHEGQITQNGTSKCYVNVSDKMTVNLTGGSLLTYKSTPVIEVERIVNSTLIKFDDPKRK